MSTQDQPTDCFVCRKHRGEIVIGGCNYPLQKKCRCQVTQLFDILVEHFKRPRDKVVTRKAIRATLQ